MTDDLMEKVARALHKDEWSYADDTNLPEFSDDKNYWMNVARAAIAAIEQSGTHVVAPAEPTNDMLMAGGSIQAEMCGRWGMPSVAYPAMLAARPKQED